MTTDSQDSGAQQAAEAAPNTSATVTQMQDAVAGARNFVKMAQGFAQVISVIDSAIAITQQQGNANAKLALTLGKIQDAEAVLDDHAQTVAAAHGEVEALLEKAHAQAADIVAAAHADASNTLVQAHNDAMQLRNAKLEDLGELQARHDELVAAVADLEANAQTHTETIERAKSKLAEIVSVTGVGST